MSPPPRQTLSVWSESIASSASTTDSFQSTFASFPPYRENSPDSLSREQTHPSYSDCTLRQIMERLPIKVMPTYNSFSGLSASHQKLEKFFWLLGHSMRQLDMSQTEQYFSTKTQRQVLRLQLVSCKLESVMKDLQEATKHLCACSQLSPWRNELRFAEDQLVNRGQATEFVTALFGQPSRDSAISRLLGSDQTTVQLQPQSMLDFPTLVPAASPPTCSIIQALYRTMERFSQRLDNIKAKVLTRGNMGPASDVANLFLLRNCGPAAVLFRGEDFPLWMCARDTGGLPETREYMQQVYERSIFRPSEVSASSPSSDDNCYAVYTSYRKIFQTVARNDPVGPVLYLRQMDLIMSFVEAAIDFQQHTVSLGRLVLEEYAAEELRIANAKADPESHSDSRTHREAYDTGIGMLLQELFVVDMPMLRKLSENNCNPDVREVLKLKNVADWPGPAIKRRKIPMRLAGILECGPDYDI